MPALPAGKRMTAAEHRLREVNSWKEKQFQDWVIARGEELGWTRIYHTYDSRRSAAGFPDLVMIHPAKKLLLYRELKTKTGRVTDEQKKWIGALLAVGADADVWRPEDVANGRIVHELTGGPVA